ncbi:GAF domain-containing SpoIIE family protein phosphatase [Streptomyces lavendofoliae]|uniref:PP2C family protein-serine/threonine phosphatase n=1 Tax=Streptomyces lavendofoliae TaxID=67314 RepID=UPI00300F5D28
MPDIVVGETATGCLPAWLTASAPGDVRGRIGDRSFVAHRLALQDGFTRWWLVDDTDHGLALQQLTAERERTRLLIEASTSLLSTLNPERCMEVTARLAAKHLADAAVVVAPVAGRRLPMVLCADGEHVEHRSMPHDPATVPGLAEALRGFPPLPSRWIDPASAPEWIVPEGFGAIGSLVVTPLPGLGVPAGALLLLRSSGGTTFGDSEEECAVLFATRAGAALSAARLYAEQAAITDVLMRELLPPQVPKLEGVEMASGYRTAGDGERVGGDFYDIHRTDEASSGPGALVVLGDVCGKGLEAAVLTGKIRNTLHALLPLADDHHRMLTLLNRALLTSHHTRFATMVLASVTRSGGGARLRLTSAGHPAPLIVRHDGTVEETDTRGSLIGVLPTLNSRTTEVTLAPGETCLLFTDGIPEARGGPMGDELFGEARLGRALAQCAGMPAEAVVERVQMLASEWVGDGKHDDMALVAITAPRGTHLTAVDGTTPGRYTG